MALIKCPECGKDVSDTAVSCPKCGFLIASNPKINELAEQKRIEIEQDQKQKSDAIKFVVITIIVIAIPIAILIGRDISEKKARQRTEDAYQSMRETEEEIERLQMKIEHNNRLIEEYKQNHETD